MLDGMPVQTFTHLQYRHVYTEKYKGTMMHSLYAFYILPAFMWLRSNLEKMHHRSYTSQIVS